MNRKINIGIDCRMAKESGIGRYITNLVKNLSASDKNNEYTLYVYENNYFEDLELPSNFKKVIANYRWHTFSEQLSFNSILKKGNHDLVHFPQTNFPILYNKDFVITIHDLTMVKLATGRASTLFYPFYLIKLLFFKLILNKALYNSKKIITVSNFVKNELINKYQINEEKIQVIYNGVDSNLVFSKETPDYFYKNYQIDKPFIFYVGNAYPHKNLERLVIAFSAFNSHNKYQLVLAGKNDFFYERLKKEFVNLENVKFVGGLTDEELSKFYSSCEFFVYPSLSEGFGIQIVEALGLGSKVCCSNNTVFPEIAESNAIYFNPNDVQDMIKSFELTSKSEKRITPEEIVKLKQKYNWKYSAQIHLNLYEKI